MDPDLLGTLLRQNESEALDFKEQGYKLVNATDLEKSELVKDILAFANAWKVTDAYILIGVREQRQRATAIPGVSDTMSDSDIQQLVNQKTNVPVRFHIEAVSHAGVTLDTIRIDRKQSRPEYLTRKFGKLDANVVYIRRGSSTAIADPTEIADIGEERVRQEAHTVPHLTAGWTPVGNKMVSEPLASVVSTTLVWVEEPKRPASEKRNRASNAPGLSIRGALGSSLFETARIVEPIKVEHVYDDPFAPKDKDWIRYARDLRARAPLSLRVQNDGTVNASNVNVELRVPLTDGLEFFDASGEPEVPRRMSAFLDPSLLVRVDETVTVEKEVDAWVLSFNFGTIQPKQIAWTKAPFYVSAKVDFSGECHGVICADDLAEPVRFTLRLDVRAKKEDFTATQLAKLRSQNVEPE